MALNKCNYIDGVTRITAQNLNDIQDAICVLETNTGDISAALDHILGIQENLIGGEGE